MTLRKRTHNKRPPDPSSPQGGRTTPPNTRPRPHWIEIALGTASVLLACGALYIADKELGSIGSQVAANLEQVNLDRRHLRALDRPITVISRVSGDSIGIGMHNPNRMRFPLEFQITNTSASPIYRLMVIALVDTSYVRILDELGSPQAHKFFFFPEAPSMLGKDLQPGAQEQLCAFTTELNANYRVFYSNVLVVYETVGGEIYANERIDVFKVAAHPPMETLGANVPLEIFEDDKQRLTDLTRTEIEKLVAVLPDGYSLTKKMLRTYLDR